MLRETPKVSAQMESKDSSLDSTGDHIGVCAAKMEHLLPAAHPLHAEDQVSSSQAPNLEESPPGQSSGLALGERVEEDQGVADQEAPVGEQGEREPRAQEPLGEMMNRHQSEAACPSPQEEKERLQDPGGGSGCLSPVDILLSTVAGLRTSEKETLHAAAAKLTTVLQEQKDHLRDKVSEIVEGVYWEISSIPAGQARRAALNVVTSLAEVAPEDVVSSLLKFSLPCDSSASEIWKSLGIIPETNTRVMWHLLQELKRSTSFPQHSCCPAGIEEGLAPLAAVRALGEIFKLFTCIGAIRGFYPPIFLALLTQIHYLVRLPGYKDNMEEEEEEESCKRLDLGGKEASPSHLHCKHVLAGHVRFAVEALKTLMLRDHNDLALLWTEKKGCWGLLASQEGHLEGVLLLARVLVTHTRHHVMGLLAEVIPQLCAREEERALTARALFVGVKSGADFRFWISCRDIRQFLCSNVATQLLPKKSILSRLQEWQVDPQPVVRWLGLQGFGNMALHRQKLKQLESMVSVILGGLEEAHEKPARDILLALGRIVSCHRGRVYLGTTALLIAEKLQPLLADERDQVRCVAIGLFGKLLSGLRLWHKIRMQEQVLSHLVPFLLGLQDPNQEVVENCEWTLARCNDFLGWNLLEEIAILAHYDSQAALDRFCKRLVRWYPYRVPDFLSYTCNYLKSPEASLRRAAGVLAGFLVFHLDTRLVRPEDLATLHHGLDHLLHDAEPSVSEAASVSILQVKHACRRALAPIFPLTLVFCCVPRWEREKPEFEDSPFKRKRSLEPLMNPHNFLL